ncbi:hypothetical protein HSX11_08425 [Oxalobacteraceae bacterium]|nr:hypothetical protein [Oxalobacteraceae bacterium]
MSAAKKTPRSFVTGAEVMALVASRKEAMSADPSMTAEESSQTSQSAPIVKHKISNAKYKIAAAARRQKLSGPSDVRLLDGELPPINGKIVISLSGKAITVDRRAKLFGPSKIEIPEVRNYRKKPAK